LSILRDLIDRSERLEEATKADYRRCVARFEAFAGPDPDGWDGRMVEAWRDHLGRQGLKPQTVNKHLYALRYAASRYEALGYGRDFARVAEGVKVRRRARRRALSVDEALDLFATCRANTPPDIRDRAIMTLGIRTGMRAAELCSLAWGNIEGRAATFRRKGGHQHTVYLDDDCIEDLEAWHTWLVSEGPPGGPRSRVFRGLRWQELAGGWYVYPSLSRQGLHEAIAARGRAAGLRRPVHAHLFRHTFISWAIDNGVPLADIMAMTDHKSLATLSGYASSLRSADNPVGAQLPRVR